jgi:hypothetical protein
MAASTQQRSDLTPCFAAWLERIVVRPTWPYGPVEFDVYAQLAELLRLSDPVPATRSM